MLSWIMGPVGRWVSGGLIAAVLAGALVLWHKNEYVPRAELNQWKKYSADLEALYDKREALIERYEEQQAEAEEVIDTMEKELGELLKKESGGDDPVVLDPSDVDRLRDFLKKHR